MLIVSFTTIPPRFQFLGGMVQALAAQTLRPDRVELTLPKTYRRFPGERPSLPPLPDWVEVIETEEDLGPSTKIIPALRRWQGQDVDLLYCDDDRPYDPDWVARMAKARKRLPGLAICERGCDISARGDFERATPPLPRAVPREGSRAAEGLLWRNPSYVPATELAPAFDAEGHVDIMMGYCGVLVRPDSFHQDVFEDPGPLWPVDDIWLSGMAAAKGTGIWATADPLPPPALSEADRTEPLLLMQSDGLNRRQLDWLGIAWFRESYDIWA